MDKTGDGHLAEAKMDVKMHFFAIFLLTWSIDRYIGSDIES